MKKTSLFVLLFVLLFISACSRSLVPKPLSTIPNPLPAADLSNIPNPLPSVAGIFRSNVKKEYFTGGKLRSEFIMSDKSGQNGLLKKYGYDGKLTSTVSIRKGVKHGTETLFDSHGRILKRTPYVNGRKEGILEAYYPNGDVMAQITYVNNVRQGKAVKYNRDGSINQQVIFKDGYLAN